VILAARVNEYDWPKIDMSGRTVLLKIAVFQSFQAKRGGAVIRPVADTGPGSEHDPIDILTFRCG